MGKSLILLQLTSHYVQKIPLPWTEENAPKLDQYLCSSFANTVFSKSSPIPSMSAPSIYIHLKPNVVSYAKPTHTLCHSGNRRLKNYLINRLKMRSYKIPYQRSFFSVVLNNHSNRCCRIMVPQQSMITRNISYLVTISNCIPDSTEYKKISFGCS